MDFIKDWFDDLQNRAEIAWKREITSIGTCNTHIGPTIRFASVTLEFSPSDQFIVADTLEPKIYKLAYELNWYRSIIFGVLDVMLTTTISPVRNIKITINYIDFNDIESTPIAFRIAARDASRKALKEHFPNITI